MEMSVMTNEELDQLSINTIRTLSIDAVQAGEVGASRHADGAGAAGLHAVEPGHALRSEGPDLAGSRPLRAVERPCLDAAVVDAASHAARRP